MAFAPRRPRALVGGAGLCAALLLAGSGCARQGPRASTTAGERPRPTSIAETGPAKPSTPPRGGSSAVQILRETTIHERPGGRPLARVGRRTEFGSIRVLAVVQRRQGWLGVIATEISGDGVGWIRDRAVREFRVPQELRADLSRRELVLLEDDRVVRRFPVAIGRPGSPTPPGRYAVTDKLRLARGGAFGCCALALSGRQPQVPQGWGGGDRLAIHGTRAIGSIGSAASAGCLRAREAAMRELIRRVTLGALLTVQA